MFKKGGGTHLHISPDIPKYSHISIATQNPLSIILLSSLYMLSRKSSQPAYSSHILERNKNFLPAK